ncbi:MAG TPA: hypothetical protein VJG83_00850 [archaeon]|nr:hypothetical protein [archaeon]
MPSPARRRRTIKKHEKIKFNEDFFKANEEKFNKKFLSKSLVEKAGVLSKVYRRAHISHRRLFNLLEMIEQTRKRRELSLGEEKQLVFAAAREAKSSYNALINDTSKVFSEKFILKLGFSHGWQIENAYMAEFHESVKLMTKIDGILQSYK